MITVCSCAFDVYVHRFCVLFTSLFIYFLVEFHFSIVLFLLPLPFFCWLNLCLIPFSYLCTETGKFIAVYSMVHNNRGSTETSMRCSCARPLHWHAHTTDGVTVRMIRACTVCVNYWKDALVIEIGTIVPDLPQSFSIFLAVCIFDSLSLLILFNQEIYISRRKKRDAEQIMCMHMENVLRLEC